MSAIQLESLRSAAMALSEPERATLALDLVSSLDAPEEVGVAEAWDVEICRRINEIEQDPSALINAEDVMQRARERLSGLNG